MNRENDWTECFSSLVLSQVTISGRSWALFAEISLSHKYENRGDATTEATFRLFLPSQFGKIFDVNVNINSNNFSCDVVDVEKVKDPLLADNIQAYEEEEGDVVYVVVKKIEPKDIVNITLKYTTQFQPEGGFLRVVLPTFLSLLKSEHEGCESGEPKRVNSAEGEVETAETAETPTEPEDEEEQPHELRVELELTKLDIKRVESPTHSIEYDLFDSSALIKFTERQNLKGDMVLLVTSDGGSQSRAYIGKNTDASQKSLPAILHFSPKYPTEDLNLCEAFFLVDCTVRMAGGRLEQIKKAVELCLIQLPRGYFFNVVAFGETFKKAFATSSLTNAANVKTALSFITEQQAEMGSKRSILSPLQEIYSSSLSNLYPRVIYIFTDGYFENQKQVLSLVNKNQQTTRIFSLALGNRSFHSSSFQIARAGRGFSLFISGNESLEAKVDALMKSSLQARVQPQFRMERFSFESTSLSTFKDMYSSIPFSIGGFVGELPTNGEAILEAEVDGVLTTLSSFLVTADSILEGEIVGRRVASMLVQEDKGKDNKEENVKLCKNYHLPSAHTSFYLQTDTLSIFSFSLFEEPGEENSMLARTNGKKMYDFNFLLQFQSFCKEPPEGLAAVGDILNLSGGGPKPPGQHDPRQRKGNDRGGPRGRGRGGRGGRGGGGGGGGDKHSAPAQPQVAPLVPSAFRWTRPNRVVQEENKKILLESQGLLNKLTLDNFEKISKKLMDIKLSSLELMEGMIKLIFDKALTEQKYSTMYADLCLRMSKNSPVFDQDGVKQNFRRILLNNCQQEFEHDKILIPEGKTEEEQEEIRFKQRKRALGNIRFIGELYKLGMLNESIMGGCIETLLDLSHENGLEGLCQLLTTIGKSLEDKNKPKMGHYFYTITELSEDPKLISRIRFLLQGLLELRDNNWVPRRKDNDPRLIAELHKQAELEEAQNEAASFRHHTLAARNKPEAATSKPRAPWDANRNAHKSPHTEKPNEKPANERPPKGASANQSSGAQVLSSSDGWEVARSTRKPDAKQTGKTNTMPTSGGRGGWKNPGQRDQETKSGQEARNAFSLLEGAAGQKSHGRGRGGRGGGRGGRGGGGGRGAERSEPRREPQHNQTNPPTRSPPPTVDVESKLEKYSTIVEEYFQSEELSEAVACVAEINTPSLHHELVNRAVSLALEKKEREVGLIEAFFAALSKDKIVNADSFVKGYTSVLEILEDLEIDIPFASQYLSRLIANSALSDSVPLSFLASSLEHLVESGKAINFFLDVLVAMLQKNEEETKRIYQSSKIDILSLLKPDERSPSSLEKLLNQKSNTKLGELVK